MGSEKRRHERNAPAEKKLKMPDEKSSTEITDLNLTCDQSDEKLCRFVKWCLSGKQQVAFSSKVYFSATSCADYGVIALDEIETNEVLFSIPNEKILSWENLVTTDEMRKDFEEMALASRWAPTVFAVMLECLNSTSSWKPYLDLFLVSNEIDLPLLWDEGIRNVLLRGLDLSERIAKDRQRIEEDFTLRVFPALRKYAGVELNSFANLLELAVKVSAFIMSYSFTRPESEIATEDDSENSDDEDDAKEQEATQMGNALLEVPVMVPVADFLNASISKNNAKLHWTENDNFLTMISTKNIKKGEEIFNTYGEISNQEMLYLYGYAENDLKNPHEEVFITSQYLKDVVNQSHEAIVLRFSPNITNIQTRWDYLEIKREVIGAESPVVLGRDGVLTDNDLHVCLRVLQMTDKEFANYSTQENTEEADEFEVGMYALSGLKNLSFEVKEILKSVILRKIAAYPRTLTEEQSYLFDLEKSPAGSISKRELWVTLVRLSQLSLLKEYLIALE